MFLKKTFLYLKLKRNLLSLVLLFSTILPLPLSVGNAISLMALKQSKKTLKKNSMEMSFCRLNAPHTTRAPSRTIYCMGKCSAINPALECVLCGEILRLASSFTIIMQIRKGERKARKLYQKLTTKQGAKEAKQIMLQYEIAIAQSCLWKKNKEDIGFRLFLIASTCGWVNNERNHLLSPRAGCVASLLCCKTMPQKFIFFPFVFLSFACHPGC